MNVAASEEAATTRIINFTDAVVAIAATLLILEPIDAAAEATDLPLREVLATNGDQLLAFAVSFVVIGHFWLLHRRLFKNVEVITQPLYWCNLLWLFSLVFLPYPTALLSGRTDDAHTCALYIGTMTLTSLAAFGLKVLVPRTEAERSGGGPYGWHLAGSAAALVAMVLATMLALLVPGVDLWGLLLLVPAIYFGRLHGKETARHQLSPTPVRERLDV